VLCAQERFGLEHVFCWHSLYGYWAGIAPDAPGMAAYDPQLVWPEPTQGEPSSILHCFSFAASPQLLCQGGECQSVPQLGSLTAM
jgi:hypothetical protein